MVVSNGEAAIIDSAHMTSIYLNFAKELGATYWLPPKDGKELEFDYSPVEGGNTATIGNTAVDIHALYSPGHTICSTSFVVDSSYLL